MTHTFEPLPRARRTTAHPPWVVCRRCGLVGLKNAASKAAARAACTGRDDPPEPTRP